MTFSYKDFIASKKGQLLLSQLAGALRRIYFIDWQRDAASDRYERASTISFPISTRHYISGAVGYQREAIERIDDIADSLISNVQFLENGDRESFAKTIRDTIEKSLQDSRVFHFRQIYGEDVSLFAELRTQNPMISVGQLATNIYVMLRASIAEWLTVFPVPRLICDTVTFGFDGISLINSSDDETWSTVGISYSNFEKWYQETRKEGKGTFTYTDAMWLVCETQGTVDGARNRAAQKMRTLVSLALSVKQDSPNVLLRVAPDIYNYAAQFPTKESANVIGEMHASIGRTFPAIAGELVLDPENLTEIKEWYKKRSLLNLAESERYTAASQFINYALNADGLERFIYFFVALDALFGERGRVEEKIREGIRRTFPNQQIWDYKIGRLFDLRSTIVHGGCFKIRDWEKYDAYRRHTKTDPERDVATAAMTALLDIQ